MNRESPILTIAIPTYNRADSLKYLVDKIIPYLNNNLKLLIIDNNSSDNTEKYMSMWNEKIKENIKCLRNNSNLGGVVNMLRCVEFSFSKYIWLLGDDDDINVKYLDELVNILSNEDSSSFHLIPKSRQNRKINKYIFNNKLDFKNNFYDITALYLMSSNIYNVEEAKKYLSKAYRLVHLQHAFSFFHSKFLEKNKIIKILKLPILEQERITLKRWAKFTAHIDALETTNILFGKDLVNKEYKIRKKQLLRISLLSSLLSYDKEGFNLEEVKRLIRLISLTNLAIPILLLIILSMNNKYFKPLLIYSFYIIFFLKHGRNYKNVIKNYLGIPKEYDINFQRNFEYSKKTIFKN